MSFHELEAIQMIKVTEVHDLKKFTLVSYNVFKLKRQGIQYNENDFKTPTGKISLTHNFF